MKQSLLLFMLMFCLGCQYFQRKPESGAYYKDRWEYSQKLLREQEFDQAEKVLKEIYLNANESMPTLSVQALFEIASLSERRGSWELALTQFKECEIKKNHLPLIRAELELPARLSGLYATLEQLTTSDIYLKKTESALQVYAAQFRQDQQTSWWAETYYKMGLFPVAYMTEENWFSFAKRFQSTAPYLIRSMEFSDPLWSQRSYDLMQTFFKKSFEFLVSTENRTEQNWIVKTETLKEQLNILLVLVQKMKLWKPLNPQKSNYVWSFYESLDMTDKELQRKLANFRGNTPQSIESVERNAILRKGRLVSPEGAVIDKMQTDPNM